MAHGAGRWLGIAMVLASAIRCGSAPSAPTSSTPVPALVISGTPPLAPGLSIQLTVTNGDGTPVTSTVTWQSSAPNVATVTASGLATGVGLGTTTVTATSGKATGVALITVQAANGATTTVASCAAISQPGSYVLTADLSAVAGSGSCLRVSSVAAVNLDCQGHLVPGLFVANVNTAMITNCTVSTSLELLGVTNVTVSHAVIRGELGIDTHSSTVVVADSTIQDSISGYAVQVVNSTGIVLLRDTIASQTPAGSASITLRNGSNNQVLQCTLTGAYDGGPTEAGTDDGIVVINESGDTIRGNTFRDFFDTALEGVQAVSGLTFIGNTISDIGTAGVGSYWCTSWTGNAIQGNDVSATPALLIVTNTLDANKCGTSTPPAPVFSNNQITGNRFHDPAIGLKPLGEKPARLYVRLFTGVSVVGNTLASNDFGTLDGPFVSPLTGFIDGGGNICGPLDPTVSNFVCTGSGGTSARLFPARRRPTKRVNTNPQPAWLD